MPKERTQLNINIDPALLLQLKSEAIRRGMTLTDFVVEQLKGHPTQEDNFQNLEQRLLKIEKILQIDQESIDRKTTIGRIFTDEGAKRYGEVARQEFELHAKQKGLTRNSALEQVCKHLNKYPHGNAELVIQILIGSHDLTGLEMTIAYRYGSCAMRSALNDWTKDPLEKLNEAFLNAVMTKSLK